MRRNGGASAPARSVFTDFFTDVDRFFDNDLFLAPMQWRKQFEANVPAVNIRENDKAYVIEVAAPGMTKEDFNIDMEEGMLTISCQKEQEQKEDKDNYRRREYNYSSFSRSFSLPESVKPEDVKAHYENGVLLLNVPKVEEKQRPKRQIKID